MSKPTLDALYALQGARRGGAHLRQAMVDPHLAYFFPLTFRLPMQEW